MVVIRELRVQLTRSSDDRQADITLALLPLPQACLQREPAIRFSYLFQLALDRGSGKDPGIAVVGPRPRWA